MSKYAFQGDFCPNAESSKSHGLIQMTVKPRKLKFWLFRNKFGDTLDSDNRAYS